MLRSYYLVLLGLVFLIPQSQALEPRSKQWVASKPYATYGPGERLVYDVSYMRFPAGEAVMEVLEQTEMDGREAYHVVSTVESNDFVSLFYPVKDRIETFIDTKRFYSHSIKVKQRQGRKRREKLIEFDQVGHRALQTKKQRGEIEKEAFDIPPEVQDSLSALYYFRMHQDLVVGQSIFIDVHESSKNWKLEIQILGRETLSTALGTFKTVKAKALVRYEGVFMDKGNVTLWLTDDERHIPVFIRTKIKVGHINAKLKTLREASKTFTKLGHAM